METKLVAVQLELTNACKLACAECPRVLMSRPVGLMDFELVKLLIRDGVEYNPDMGFNVNGLGEPLLYPKFSQTIEFMDECGAKHVDLFTSLVAAEANVIRSFEALNRSKMSVTLAMTKHLYDGKGNRQIADELMFDQHVHRAIDMLGHVEKHIGMVLTKYHTEDDVKQFTDTYGPLFKPENLHVIRNLNPWFNLVKDMAHPDFGASPPSLGRNICDYPFILMHVGWNGDVIVCCTDDVDGECVFGTIREPGDLKRIWHGDALEEMRRKHREYIIDMAPCNKCERTAWAREPQPIPA